MKILSPKAHAPLDYVLAVVFALAPSVLGFGETATLLSYVVGGTVLVLSLVTAYPLGVAKLVPFTVHGAIEMVTAPLLIVAPWLFGFAENGAAKWFFVAVGLGYLAVWAITDYRRTQHDGGRGYLSRASV